MIDYKGFRIIAQAIIPGIISNLDQSTLTEYGSVDEGKTIFKTDEFHTIMKEVVDHLSITHATIKDEKGGEHEMAGSIECKGIRGTDRRRYLLDLIWLTPRDSNYPEEKFQTRLVRRELMVIYQWTKSLEYATEKMKGET